MLLLKRIAGGGHQRADVNIHCEANAHSACHGGSVTPRPVAQQREHPARLQDVGLLVMMCIACVRVMQAWCICLAWHMPVVHVTVLVMPPWFMLEFICLQAPAILWDAPALAIFIAMCLHIEIPRQCLSSLPALW